MNLVVTVREAVVGTSLAYLSWGAANSSWIEVCNHAPLSLPKLRDLKSLSLIWRWFSRWGRERVTSAFAYTGGQCICYDHLHPMPTLIIQDARPRIVDTPLTLISRMGQGAFVYIFWAQRRPVHQKKKHTTTKCQSFRKRHAILLDTPGDLTSASKYF